MTITELYKQLADKDFQDPLTGNLFFPAYMYVYGVDQHYAIEREILDIKDRLHRPNSYLSVLVIDVFDSFLDFLKQEKFGQQAKFDFYMEQEQAAPLKVRRALVQDANNDRFYAWLNTQIKAHFESSGDFEVGYVFVKGFGAVFPFLRANKFMSKFEKYISGYKMVLFYPGEVKEHYKLFGLLNDEHLYRAIKLINQ